MNEQNASATQNSQMDGRPMLERGNTLGAGRNWLK
jgi:hypothetical protein